MIKRTIEISKEPVHLAVRLDQLVLNRNGDPVGTIPCEDVGVVVVDQPQTTYTHAALTGLTESGATVVLCGPNHLPCAAVLPLSTHSQVVSRIAEQLAASKPLRKRLWRQIVQAKIRAQAANLEVGRVRNKMLAIARQVKSGDPANVEAHAARIYWRHWLSGEDFRRDRDLPGVNAFLNYGYAIMRAAVARALVAAGLLPALGLHHRNRSNAFCLADDLVEPLRPFVDARVRSLYHRGIEVLSQEAKAELLQVLVETVRTGHECGPLMVSLHRMAASLVRCYGGESQWLELPRRGPATEHSQPSMSKEESA
jgi:CRISPR-associated protein Cas1